MHVPHFGRVSFSIQGPSSQPYFIASVFAPLDEAADDQVFIQGSSIAFQSKTAQALTHAVLQKGNQADIAQDEALLRKKLLQVYAEIGQDAKLAPPAFNWQHPLASLSLLASHRLYRKERALYQAHAPLVKEKLAAPADEFGPKKHVIGHSQQEFARAVEVWYKLPPA